MRARQLSIQQGRPDGLCGIYTLLNFLNCHVQLNVRAYDDVDEANGKYTTKDEENERRIFRELMHSAEETGNLCAETICNGFAPPRLKATYERLLARNNIDGECRIEERDVPGDIFEISAHYLRGSADGMARGIGVLHADDSHWVLIARARDDRLLIFDSSEAERSYHLTRRQDGRRARNERSLSSETLLLLSLQPKES